MSQIVDPAPYCRSGSPVVRRSRSQLGERHPVRRRAFLQVHDSLAFFRNVYDAFAGGYRAAIIRLDGLITVNETGKGATVIDRAAECRRFGCSSTTSRSGHRPGYAAGGPARRAARSGRVVGDHRRLRDRQDHPAAQPGTTVAVHLGAHCAGPQYDTMFLSQLPYVPLGDLRSVVSLPLRRRPDFDDAAIRAGGLTRSRWGHLESRLDEVPRIGPRCSRPASSSGSRSPVFSSPSRKRSFLDEATSALDEGQEFALYRALRTRLPDCIVVSVSHRPTLEQHHDRRLQLLGGGALELRLASLAPRSPA